MFFRIVPLYLLYFGSYFCHIILKLEKKCSFLVATMYFISIFVNDIRAYLKRKALFIHQSN